jgi:DNA-binding transcriptional MerR regulator
MAWAASRAYPLRSARTPSGYRDYGPEAIDRLESFRHAQTAGLTLDEIRQVLAISDGGRPPCEHVGELIHRRLTHLDQRMRELTETTRRRLRHLAQRAAEQDSPPAGGTTAPFNHPEPTTDRPPSITTAGCRVAVEQAGKDQA